LSGLFDFLAELRIDLRLLRWMSLCFRVSQTRAVDPDRAFGLWKTAASDQIDDFSDNL
jgi:hypothetical protein